MQLRPGLKLRSTTCSTEVIVVAGSDDLDLTCGGAPMVGPGEEAIQATADPELCAGTQMGKRYVNEAGSLEVLCTKPGPGSLGLGSQPLVLKEAKPLPSSD